MTSAKLPTKFKLCTTSKSKTSLKKKIKKEGKKKKELQQRMRFGVCFVFFLLSVVGGGEGEKSAEETVGISKEKYLFNPQAAALSPPLPGMKEAAVHI